MTLEERVSVLERRIAELVTGRIAEQPPMLSPEQFSTYLRAAEKGDKLAKAKVDEHLARKYGGSA
jgi:hypothetical protein